MKGWAELLLLGAVCTACWLRTPVGAIGHNVVAWTRDQPGRDLLDHFSTQIPPRVDRALRLALAEREGGELPDAPAGWTPALHLAVRAHLGEDAATQLEALGMSNPEAALEIWAIGADLRTRAIWRAKAAGEPRPELLEAHRRFLPAEQAAKADKAVSEVMSLATALDLAWPVPTETRVSSPFGWRQHPTLNKRRFHEGVDLAVPVGTPIWAAGSGIIQRAKQDSVNGKYVVVEHGHGITTAYCHGDDLHVSPGQTVQRGQEVMDSGNTGRSSGPHLHFGLRIDGRAVDPAVFLSSDSTVGSARASGSFAPPVKKPEPEPQPEMVSPAAQAPPVVETPPVAEEPPAVDEPPAVEEPRAVEEAPAEPPPPTRVEPPAISEVESGS